MDPILRRDIRQAYQLEISRLEREFFDGMKEGKVLEELKPMLLRIKQAKLHLTSLNMAAVTGWN